MAGNTLPLHQVASYDPGPILSDSIGSVHLLPHTLNQAKQTKNLLDGTTKADVVFEVSPSMENVNVYCNPGFYKPAFCTLTKGFTFSIGDINLSYSKMPEDQFFFGKNKNY